MIRTTPAAALAAALLLAGPAAAQGHGSGHGAGHGSHGAPAAGAQAAPVFRAGALTVEAPWTRATPGGAKVAGGYMRITNAGSAPDRLVGGSIPGSGRSEVHQTSESGGVARMAALEKGLEIRPGETVELKPGGHHLMLMDLTRALKEGEAIQGALVFERAGQVPVTFAVRGLGAGGAGHGAHGAGQHKH